MSFLRHRAAYAIGAVFWSKRVNREKEKRTCPSSWSKTKGLAKKTGRENGLFGGVKLRIRLLLPYLSVNGLILDAKGVAISPNRYVLTKGGCVRPEVSPNVVHATAIFRSLTSSAFDSIDRRAGRQRLLAFRTDGYDAYRVRCARRHARPRSHGCSVRFCCALCPFL